jgi:hypothetical protein
VGAGRCPSKDEGKPQKVNGIMAKLEEIVKDAWVKGITPDGTVKIERAEMIGSDSLESSIPMRKGEWVKPFYPEIRKINFP